MAEPREFFVSGGTVPPDSPSYVERTADRNLFASLEAGEYCYVLNSRQMGKSSLAVRTISKLNGVGVHTGFVDLTRLGGPNVSPEQWYSGLLVETGRSLGLRTEAAAHLRESRDLGPGQRYLAFLQEVVLPQRAGQVVVMIDEIDAIRSLGFSTDEFFAGIRQLFNGRADDPELRRLTFCLLGAALPSDLIKDARVTPFNVGKRIDLQDFTSREAKPFAAVVGQARLDRVLHWTSGHPFLTQTLCAGLSSGRDVDETVRGCYLEARARETDTNLADVGNRLLGKGDPNVEDGARADTLSLYAKLLKSGIPDDESNAAAARIKMSGVARLENGRLTIRNRIYAEVFDKNWIRENMPGQELRRQKRAFWLGVARSTAISIVVIVTVGALGWRNYQLANRMEQQRNEARYDSYVASMQTMAQKQREGNFSAIERTLDEFKNNPARGWEWNFWNRVVNQGGARLVAARLMVTNAASPPSGKLIAVTDADSLEIYNVETMKRTARIPLVHSIGGPWIVAFYRDGKRVLVQDLPGKNLVSVDAIQGKILAERLNQFAFLSGWADLWWDSANDGYTFVGLRDPKDPSRLQMNRMSLDTFAVSAVDTTYSNLFWATWFNKSGSRVACGYYTKEFGGVISIRATDSLKEIRRFPVPARTIDLRFDPDNRTMIVCDGKTIRRSAVDTDAEVWSIPYSSPANLIDLSPDGQRLLASTATRRAREYDVSSKLAKPRLIREISNASALFFADSGRRILAFGDDWRVIDDEHRQSSPEVQIKGAPYFSMQTDSKDRLVLFSTGSILSLDRNNPLASPIKLPAPLSGVLDASGRYIYSINDRTFTDSLGDHRTIAVPLAPASFQWFSAANPNGDLIAVGQGATDVSILDVPTGKVRKTLSGIGGPCCIRFSNDGGLLAVADAEGVVTVWSTLDWSRVAAGRLGRNYSISLGFSDDGAKIACGLAYGDCGILDIRTGRCLHLQGHSEGVNFVCWSHDGTRLASGSDDTTVRLWDTATGKEIGIVGEHSKGVMAVWFVKGDRTLCSIDINGVLKLWETSDRL